MVALAPGVVVLVRFPFSDLSSTKLRPAAVLAAAGGVDWILCQITSNPYGDLRSVRLTPDTFAVGGLERESFARPSKLFTASGAIVLKSVAVLSREAHEKLVEAAVVVLRSDLRRE